MHLADLDAEKGRRWVMARWFRLVVQMQQLARTLSPMAPPCQGDPKQPIRLARELELGGEVLGGLATYESAGERVGGRRGGELKERLLVTLSSGSCKSKFFQKQFLVEMQMCLQIQMNI